MATRVGTFVDKPSSRGVAEATRVSADVPVGEGVAAVAPAVGVSIGLTGNRGISAMR